MCTHQTKIRSRGCKGPLFQGFTLELSVFGSFTVFFFFYFELLYRHFQRNLRFEFFFFLSTEKLVTMGKGHKLLLSYNSQAFLAHSRLQWVR